MTPLDPKTPYDYPEASERVEGIYQHVCAICGHLFFGYKSRRGWSCHPCHTKNFTDRG